MPPLPKLSGKEQKLLSALGFVNTRTRGSNMMFKHSDGRRTTITIHANEEIGLVY